MFLWNPVTVTRNMPTPLEAKYLLWLHYRAAGWGACPYQR